MMLLLQNLLNCTNKSLNCCLSLTYRLNTSIVAILIPFIRKMAESLHPSIVQVLTPVKTRRKKRASFSPTKTVATAPKARTQSETLNPKPAAPESGESLATASLEFENFAFWNDDGVTMKTPTRTEQNALFRYLNEKFCITEMQMSQPFLILWCEHGIPAQNERPFSIGGCIAVWLNKDDAVPGDLSIGDYGRKEEELVVGEDIAADLRAFHLPRAETLRGISKYFPGCIFVSFLTHQLIIEFERREEETWFQHLETLPEGIANTGVPISYHNGPLVATELKRRRKPQPRCLNGEEDDTDYIKSDGCFYPGVMLKADSDDQISAGIAVQKGHETRVTVAFHCWNSENEQNPENLGDPNHFKVTQGETHIGHVAERISDTDIGLMKMKDGIAFNNRFLELDTVAGTLISTSKLSLNEEFVIDSFVTGRQRLRLQGIRLRGEEGLPGLKGEPEDLPTPENYLAFPQGIYATGALEIHTVPRIRDGVCGSPVVRLKAGKEAGTRQDVLHRGEVCGFMHWSNLQLKYGSGGLLCFADSVDDLIEEGWEVSKIAKKRDADADDEDQEDVSPSKKRK